MSIGLNMGIVGAIIAILGILILYACFLRQ